MPEVVGQQESLWHSASAIVNEEFIVKFAWSNPAALRISREVAVLKALVKQPVPFLPELVASSEDPVLLVTRRVEGMSLFKILDSIDREYAGEQLAYFLTALQEPATARDIVAAIGNVPAVSPPPTTASIRLRSGRWIRPEQYRSIAEWCDWADAVLQQPCSNTLVHGDFHGDNQVWNHDKLLVVVDFETAGFAEPEYELRALPWSASGVELLNATMRHYQQLSGRLVSAERVMAWHLRQALGDMLWRSEGGLPLPNDQTPEGWIDGLSARLSQLGITFEPHV